MKILRKTGIFSLFTLFFGCYHTNEFLYHDPMIQLHEYEMVSKIQNKNGRKIKKTTNNQTRIAEEIYAPEEPQAIADKIVSINVTEETPVVDVIMELSRLSGTDVQIDPTIIGGVNLNLKDKPLRSVFKRICGLTDTRYREKYGIVVFERDIPYSKIYNIDFLDATRNIQSSITLNTSGLSSTSATGGGTSTVTSDSKDTFWGDIVSDIRQIIQTTENTNKIYTKTAERVQRIAKNEEEERQIQKDINDGVYNEKIGSTKTIDRYDNVSDMNNQISDENIRINKRAGIMTVTASTKSHLKIEEYLQKLKRKATTQVLIEMRFLEINLKKEYQGGINWNNIRFGKFGKVASAKLAPDTINLSTGFTSFAFNKGIDAVANLFEQFGSTRTLSNPRINAVNNQPALMTFATNYVYFKTKSSYTPSTYSTTYVTQAYRNVESEAQTMPLGIIMSVLPSIDLEKREIMLNIRPTISKLESEVEDPAVTVLYNEKGETSDSQKVKSSIPIANIRELDTILKLKDGQTAVIGGFTERIGKSTDSGVPIMRALPIVGNLFSKKDSSSSSTETILLVKATIVDNGKQMSEYDKNIYESFSDDPRMNEI